MRIAGILTIYYIINISDPVNCDFSIKRAFGRIGSVIGIGSRSSDDSSECNDPAIIDSAIRFGSTIVKPATNLLFPNKESPADPETTTPYNYAKYAYSPGYYKGSIITCSGDVLNVNTIAPICVRDRTEIPCNETFILGDVIKVNCKIGYDYPRHSVVVKEIECMENGRWNAPIYECQPTCGKLTKKSSALIVHGEETDVTEFPWNVAIYKGEILICGGNIISEKVIISAAHCFSQESAYGVDDVPAHLFTVAAGKYFRDKEAAEKYPIQYFTIKKIKKHDTYYGFSGNYDADIAVITLNEKIMYQPHIGPVCLNFELKTIVEKQIPIAGTMGLVAGYGYAEFNDKPSDRLKKIELPIVDTRQCKMEAPENFKPFVTSDKFCAGYNDGTGGVCKGDSGAGFVVPKIVDDEAIYYIHGIVSNTRSINGGCDMNFYTMFTHVQNYIDIIKEEVRASKI